MTAPTQSDRIESKLDKLAGMETTLAVLDERTKSLNEKAQELKDAHKAMATEYAVHAQAISSLRGIVGEHHNDIEYLKRQREAEEAEKPKKAYKDGKHDGVMISVASVTHIIKPYLIPLVMLALGYGYIEKKAPEPHLPAATESRQ